MKTTDYFMYQPYILNERCYKKNNIEVALTLKQNKKGMPIGSGGYENFTIKLSL